MKIPTRSLFGRSIIVALALMAWQASPVAADDLPTSAPVPEERPDVAPAGQDGQDLPDTAPTPDDKPDDLPQPAPIPSPQTDPDAPQATGTKETKEPPAKGPAAPSATEIACLAQLKQIGAVFRPVPAPPLENGCSLPHPLEVSSLGSGVDVVAPVTVNCATALAAAKLARDVVQPAARELLGQDVKSIEQASGYVCRPRRGTSKLSEHAFGNALDIASFTLVDGKVVAVEPDPPDSHQKFLRKVRDASCGPFKTVLGPGSDADHALHLHLDLAQRRNGGVYCK